MNKEPYILIIVALMMIPLAVASVSESVENILSVVFDASGDQIYLKAALWIVISFFGFKGLERIMNYDRWKLLILAFVIATISTRYIPVDQLEFLQQYIIVILFIGLPFLVGSTLGDLFRWGRAGKTLLILLAYGASGYYLMKWQGLESEANDTLSLALMWLSDNRLAVVIIAGIICIFLINRWRRVPSAGGGYDAPQQVYSAPPPQQVRPRRTSSGPSSWRRMRNRGRQSKQWFRKRRALAKRRAMLKSGWRRAEGKYREKIRKMPKGKYIKKGTSGYVDLRRRQMRFAKSQKRQGKKPGFSIKKAWADIKRRRKK